VIESAHHAEGDPGQALQEGVHRVRRCRLSAALYAAPGAQIPRRFRARDMGGYHPGSGGNFTLPARLGWFSALHTTRPGSAAD
jgi:hypothetical protein